MCPLCLTAVSSTEQELLSHLLAAHPVEAALLALGLSVFQIVLSRQPGRLLIADVAVLGLAVVLSRGPNTHR